MLDDLLLPENSLNLHIFEPHYRLMIRRCLEGSKIFGVANSDLQGTFVTTTFINDKFILPDGRSLIKIKYADFLFKKFILGNKKFGDQKIRWLQNCQGKSFY